MTDPDVRDRERARNLMMGALDGELSEAEQSELDDLIGSDSALKAELEQLKRVKEVTGSMAYNEPPREVWDTYWAGVYRRFERGIAWILVSVGAIVMISWGAWQAIEDIIADSSMPLVVKLGIGALTVGLVVLLVSVAREKLFTRRSDPYKDIVR